jgi:hypothetical protein
MKEYIIEHKNTDNNVVAYSFYRGETKEEVKVKFRRDFPKYTIISIETHKEFK